MIVTKAHMLATWISHHIMHLFSSGFSPSRALVSFSIVFLKILYSLRSANHDKRSVLSICSSHQIISNAELIKQMCICYFLKKCGNFLSLRTRLAHFQSTIITYFALTDWFSVFSLRCMTAREPVVSSERCTKRRSSCSVTFVINVDAVRLAFIVVLARIMMSVTCTV